MSLCLGVTTVIVKTLSTAYAGSSRTCVARTRAAVALTYVHGRAQDVHITGGMLASCGLDNTVKLWALDTPSIQGAIEKSYSKPDNGDDSTPFQPVRVVQPTWSTSRVRHRHVCRALGVLNGRALTWVCVSHQVHSGYVDYIVWIGDLLLSKHASDDSDRHFASLWTPTPLRGSVRFSVCCFCVCLLGHWHEGWLLSCPTLLSCRDT